MSEDRTDLVIEILKSIQADIGEIKRDINSLSTRVSSLEDHFRGTLTTLYGIQSDVAHLKVRVDRMEERLGVRDTER